MGELLFGWFFLAALVAVLAATKGHSAIGWLVLACLFSPLIAGLVVLVLPNRRQEALLRSIAGRTPARPEPPKKLRHNALLGGKSSRVTVERDPDAPFDPDGLYAGIPYRVTAQGAVEAVIQGKIVRFLSLERFVEMVGSSSERPP